MKKYISDILHDADEKTIDIIADNHRAADNRTKERIYRKSLHKTGLPYESSEAFIAEHVKRSPFMGPAMIAAACFLVLAGAVFGLLKMNAAPPSPVDDMPVIVATATTVSKTTDTFGTTVTTVGKTTDTVRTTATAWLAFPLTTEKAVETAQSTTETAAKTEAVKTDITATMPYTTAVTNTTNMKTTTTAAAPIVPEKHMTMEEILEWESRNWACVLVRERAVCNGYIDADSPRITLEQVKQFIAESSGFNEIFTKIKNVQQYEDVSGGSGISLIEFWVGGNRNDIVMVCPEGENIEHITSPDGNIYGSEAKSEVLFRPQ